MSHSVHERDIEHGVAVATVGGVFKNYSADRTFVSVALGMGRTLKDPRELAEANEDEPITRDNQVDHYRTRLQHEDWVRQYPVIRDMSLLNFVRNFKVKEEEDPDGVTRCVLVCVAVLPHPADAVSCRVLKLKARKNPRSIVPVFYPRVSSRRNGKDYPWYCFNQLLRHRPWSGAKDHVLRPIGAAEGAEAVPLREDFQDENGWRKAMAVLRWPQFLQSPLGQQVRRGHSQEHEAYLNELVDLVEATAASDQEGSDGEGNGEALDVGLQPMDTDSDEEDSSSTGSEDDQLEDPEDAIDRGHPKEALHVTGTQSS